MIFQFNKLLDKDSERPLGKIFDLKNEAGLFFLCDSSQIQDAFRFRVLRRSLALAHFIVNEKGVVQKEKVEFLIKELQKEGELVYPGGYNDWEMRSHFLKCLHQLKEDSFLRLVHKFALPLCHSKAETLVRESIGLESQAPLKDEHVRIAVLSALFCPLRQNVGSCFATAPAILVHEEQSGRFLEDLLELLATGKLKRTFGGKEFVVPMSPSSGSGDLKKNIFVFSSKERILFSPGLLFALSKVGLIDPQASIEKKLEALSFLAAPQLEDKEKMNVEDLIVGIVLNQFNFTENDLQEFEQSKRKLFKSGQIMATGKKRESIEKADQVIKSALSYFKSFADHLLLKTWEFTIASFVDVKWEFSSWNLYTSLGLHSEEREGIGEIVRRFIEAKIEEKNEKIKTFQAEYEIAYDQLRGTERLLKNAGSESEAARLRAEYQSRYYHMQVCLELRDKNFADANEYASFFSFVIEKYSEKFQDYFQEIYDAELQGVVLNSLYDDSPAGFRLIYKHGRSDAAVWSFIHNKEEYIQSLVNFFLAAEHAIEAECEWKEGKEAISSMTTTIIQHVGTEAFLKGAFMRMARAHHMRLQDMTLEKAEKKPWAYTSGGTMNTLLKTYFRRENFLSEESKWVESPMDLLIFIIDVLKMAPQVPFGQRMLITSPTHAFSLLTHHKLFQEAYEFRGFTYTWVRDHILLPQQQFYEKLLLNSSEQKFLIEKFLENIPIRYHKTISLIENEMTIKEFRNHILEALGGNSIYFATELDSFLYQMLPLSYDPKMNQDLEELLEDWKIEDISPPHLSKFIGAKDLRDQAVETLLQSKGTLWDSEDAYLKIVKKARHLGLAPPEPIVFADSNWSERECYFSFLVNPGTSELELWLVDRTGNLGRPMHIWKNSMNGEKNLTWTIYFNAQEYFFPVNVR